MGSRFPPRSPFFEDYEDGAGHHAKTNKIIPFQWLVEAPHRKGTKHDQGNHFLDCFQLGLGEFSALMIHERFYCNHGYTAAAGGLAAQSVNVLRQSTPPSLASPRAPLATCLRDFVTNRHESPGLLPDPIRRRLQAIFKKGDPPTGQNHNPQGRVFVFEMPVPGKGHKDVGNGQQENRVRSSPHVRFPAIQLKAISAINTSHSFLLAGWRGWSFRKSPWRKWQGVAEEGAAGDGMRCFIAPYSRTRPRVTIQLPSELIASWRRRKLRPFRPDYCTPASLSTCPV